MERNLSWVYNALPLDPAKRDLSYMQQAFNDFQKLIQMYPNSSYAADSRKRMIHIRSLLANHELQTAEFYYQRKAYVAAANRASYVVQHLPGAKQVPQALAIMVKSYRAIGEKQLENDAMQVLKLNYPDTSEFKSLG
jgi:outer membrane protein assembly factor BamD